MKIAIPKERRANEPRVAASPETVKKFKALGLDVVVESEAGLGSAFTNEAYEAMGATIAPDLPATLDGADIVLKVMRPLGPEEGGEDELAHYREGMLVLGILQPYQDKGRIEALAHRGLTAFTMEFMPRITRAQSMDVLSSQSNLAGYRAVLDAVYVYNRAMPMMMTAAGTVAPARALILGAGVAGLQAIATARRLGAIVSAFDVRASTKEQVQSLGATFIDVEGAEDLETKAGYAREASEDFKRKQQEKIHETLKKQDIVITTALIPGKPAPVLITEEMVNDMKQGSVIVDLAVESGGNCPLSRPGEIVEHKGVKIVGHYNMAGRIASDASNLYAKNLFNFLGLMIDKDGPSLKIDWEDEIIQGTCLTRGGAVIHPALTGGGA